MGSKIVMANKCARLVRSVVIGMCIAHVGWCREPVEVTACQLKADPPVYDRKVVQVTGFVSHAFEDFTLFDPKCESWPGIWLEYGGSISSLTTYLGGGKLERTRPKELVVDGVAVPLVVNKQFEEFDKAIQPPFRSGDQGVIRRATLIGRFFAGKRLELFKGKPWGGFGHMGCCMLLAIQEIQASDTQNRRALDYGSSADQPKLEKAGCSYSYLLAPDQSALLEWQRKVDEGEYSWALDDPKRVALEALSHAANAGISLMNNLRLSREAQGRMVYTWAPRSKDVSYMVVVSRPYWLSFYAHDANRVAWTAIAAYKSSC